MGSLTPQTVKTLFGGVSQQPHSVRRENQVSVSDNALPSIVTGGFEKRPCSQYISKLKTIENLLLGSEDLDNATYWSEVETFSTAEATGATAVTFTAPYGLPIFLLTDGDSASDAALYQGITVTALYGYYAGSIYLKAGTVSVARVSVEFPTEAVTAVATVDLSAGTVTTSGTAYIRAGLQDMGEGWYRVHVVGIKGNDTVVRMYVRLGSTNAATGTIYATGAQLEKFVYENQEWPSPYAFTEATQWARTVEPGEGDTEYFVHPIDRDQTEQYLVLVSNGELHVYDTISGEPRQVIIGDSTRTFLTDGDLASTSSVEIHEIAYASYETEIAYTITWSGGTVGAPDPIVTIYHSVDGTSWTSKHVQTITTADGSATTSETLAAGTKYVKVAVTTADTTGVVSVKGAYRDTMYLKEGSPFPEDFSAVSVADHTFLANRNVTVRMGGSGHPEGITVTNGTYQNFTKLPTAGAGYKDELAYVSGDDIDNFAGYWVVCRLDGTTYYWEETASPDVPNSWNNATMPHELTRLESGRFVFAEADWASRLAGDDEVNPEPSFANQTIENVFFFRGRLGILASENVILSRLNDVYSFFAEKAVDTLDTDPVDRVCSTEKVTLLRWAVPFRKLLFLTSGTMQFELSSTDVLTPDTAALDPSTSYAASSYCRPALMGDTLYFAATRPGGSTVYEYYFQEASLSNTAEDITKHVVNYIPEDIVQMRADPTSATIFSSVAGEANSLYCYRAFWDKDDKVMSAWFRYTMGADETEAFIHGIAVFSGYLVMVVEREDGLYLEQVPIDRETEHEGYGPPPLLDQRVETTGVYSLGTNLTTFTCPYPHKDRAVVILGADWTSQVGRQLPVTYSGDYLITVVGDYSADTVYMGIPYTMEVVPSKLFLRDQDGAAITDGSLKLKDIRFSHADTGYYRVEVTPLYRDTFTTEFTGNIVGSEDTVVGARPIVSGTLLVPVKTDASTVAISIKNDSPLPCVITSFTWRGFYMEVSRSR